MPTTREEAIELIQNMPQDCTITDIMAELHFKQKVGRGLKDIEEGRLLTHDEVKERMKEWVRSIGR